MKACLRCKTEKPYAEFNRKRAYGDGFDTRCRPCQNEVRRARYAGSPEQRAKRQADSKGWQANNPARKAVTNRRWVEANRDKVTAISRAFTLAKYGLTPETFDLLFEAQGFVCAICGGADHRGIGWNVDHCHTTGKVRGILCAPCNMGIGSLGDDPEIVRRALTYLEESSERRYQG